MSAAESFAATGQEMFVDGSWGPSRSGETYEATSPATGEVIGTVAQGDREDAKRAIDAAGRAAEAWAGLTAFDRAARMHAVGDAIEARRDELARTLTLDQGKPLAAEAYGEVEELVDYWRMAAEDAKRLGGELPNSFSPGKRVMLVRRPLGVVGVISPWNWPYTMPAELIAPALACGNTVVWTPAPSTAVCAVALARCIAEADIPPGVFNLVTGPGPVVGNEIAANPGVHGVAFIGSTTTGRLVAQAAAGKVALLEMGGNGPVVVMDDADVDAAVEATLTACYLCAGPELHRGRAHPRPPRRARRVPREARSAGDRAGPARRPVRRRARRWARSTTSRWPPRWTSTSPTRSTAARRWSPAASAPTASRPSSTGRRRSSPTCPPTPWSPPRRHSARSRRSWRSTPSSRRSS